MGKVRLNFSGVSLASKEPPDQGMSLLVFLWRLACGYLSKSLPSVFGDL